MWTKRAQILLFFLVTPMIVYVILALSAHPAPDHPYYQYIRQFPLVIAHRGGMGLWPEETLYAFEQAEAIGVDVLEIDIRKTADNVLVLMHDNGVDRTTDGIGAVESLTLDEIKTFDAGYTWTVDGGATFPYRGKGIKVPTLEEVFLQFPDSKVNIEIKHDETAISTALCELIRKHSMERNVLVVSEYSNVLKAFRQECREVATGADRNEAILFFVVSKIYLEAAFTPSANTLQVPEYIYGLHVVTPRFVDGAKHRNLKIEVWTVNDLEDMEKLIDLGVDGLMTDYPDQMIKLLDR